MKHSAPPQTSRTTRVVVLWQSPLLDLATPSADGHSDFFVAPASPTIMTAKKSKAISLTIRTPDIGCPKKVMATPFATFIASQDWLLSLALLLLVIIMVESRELVKGY